VAKAGFTASALRRMESVHAPNACSKSIPNERFALELREVLATYSPYGDGLSFGQASTSGRPYVSPQFLTSIETEEPYDQLEFTGVRIDTGAKVSVRPAIGAKDTPPPGTSRNVCGSDPSAA